MARLSPVRLSFFIRHITLCIKQKKRYIFLYKVERKVPWLSQMNSVNKCGESAAKLTLILNFKVKILFALYSTHYEGKTFPRNRSSFLKMVKKIVNTANARVLTATLWL